MLSVYYVMLSSHSEQLANVTRSLNGLQEYYIGGRTSLPIGSWVKLVDHDHEFNNDGKSYKKVWMLALQ